MIDMYWILTFIAIPAIAFIIAKTQQKNGYFFWRTFIFSTIGLFLLVITTLKTIG